jgi:hypothetical protein
MDGQLATPARQLKFRVLRMTSERGELRLKDGLITFTSDARGLLFRAPLDEVRASFPKLIFPVPYFGIGVKLTVNGKTYRLSFMRNSAQSRYLGWKADSYPSEGGTSIGPTWLITRPDTEPAKAAVRQWRAAFERQANSG